jgi:hypothetical protein
MKTIKITKTFISILLITCFACSILFTQDKNSDYQTILAKAQMLFDKQPETFNKNDLAQLNDLINLDINRFGEENVRLCKNLIEQAKKKKKDYEQYITRMHDMSSTLDELDDETYRRQNAEQENSELISENSNLKQIVEDLKGIIDRFAKQEKKLNAANARLQNENLAAKDLLKTSSDIVAQMLMLMPNIRMDNTIQNSLQRTLKDSLEEAQCRVAQLLKSNFLITIQQLKTNQQFIDSANLHYITNNSHLSDVQNYMDNGSELVQRLRKSGIDCAIGYATDIEAEMNDFISIIENTKDNAGNFLSFITNNIYWIIPVLLILIIGIVILVRNTTSTNKKD